MISPDQYFVHLSDNPPSEITYEVHLDPPYIPEGCENDPSKWVRHYIGSAEHDRMMQRAFGDHGTKNGARVLEVARQAGCSWHLVRTWAGGLEKEHQLKQSAGTKYCPEAECAGAQARPAATEPKEHYNSRRDRRDAQAVREFEEREREIERRNGVEVKDAREISPGELSGQAKAYERTPEDEARIEEAVSQLEKEWRDMARRGIPAPSPREPDNGANLRQLGTDMATQQVIDKADAGMSPDRIAQEQAEHADWLESQAQAPEAQAFARAYGWTSDVLTRDLAALAREPERQEQREREAV